MSNIRSCLKMLWQIRILIQDRQTDRTTAGIKAVKMINMCAILLEFLLANRCHCDDYDNVRL